MSAFLPGRRRRADDGRFLPKDAEAWRRLVRRAREQAERPGDDAYPLLRSADGCGKAVIPPGVVFRGSCFERLLQMGRLWWRLAADVRAQRAGELREIADACEASLNGPRRADTHGED